MGQCVCCSNEMRPTVAIRSAGLEQGGVPSSPHRDVFDVPTFQPDGANSPSSKLRREKSLDDICHQRHIRVASISKNPSLSADERIQLINIEVHRKAQVVLSSEGDGMEFYKEVTFHIPDDDVYFSGEVPPTSAVQYNREADVCAGQGAIVSTQMPLLASELDISDACDVVDSSLPATPLAAPHRSRSGSDDKKPSLHIVRATPLPHSPPCDALENSSSAVNHLRSCIKRDSLLLGPQGQGRARESTGSSCDEEHQETLGSSNDTPLCSSAVKNRSMLYRSTTPRSESTSFSRNSKVQFVLVEGDDNDDADNVS